MASTLRVKPGQQGLRVPVPGRPAQPLDPAGEVVELTTYWRRRLASGDVVTVDAPRPDPKPSPSQKPRASKD